jgi:hypothetical protein
MQEIFFLIHVVLLTIVAGDGLSKTSISSIFSFGRTNNSTGFLQGKAFSAHGTAPQP